MVIKIFYSSIKKVFGNIKLWLFIFLSQLILSIFIGIPLSSEFRDFAGRSLSAGSIFSGGIISISITEFNIYNQGAVQFAGLLLIWLLFFFLFFYMFLKGGIISFFMGKEDKFTFAGFFKDSSFYFFRFIRLFLFSILFLIPVLLLNIPLSALAKSIAADSESLILLLLIIQILIIGSLMVLVKIAFDFAQIRTIFTKNRVMRTSIKEGWRFVFRYPFKTLGLFFIFFAAAIALTLIYLAIIKIIPPDTAFGSILYIVWQQIYGFARTGLVLGFIAGEVQLFSQFELPFLKWWYNDKD